MQMGEGGSDEHAWTRSIHAARLVARGPQEADTGDRGTTNQQVAVKVHFTGVEGAGKDEGEEELPLMGY